jgi:repressor LexA
MTMLPIMYKRQRAVLEFISQYMQKHGFAPTIHEICDAIGVSSPATVHEHLVKLEKIGMLKRDWRKMRGMEVTNQKAAGWLTHGIEVPLYGYIAAGRPIEAIANPTEFIQVPQDMVGKRRTYVLQVKGDSMIEAAIQDGDYVIVEEQDVAQNGEIVVALLNDTFATLKRFFKEPDHVRLEPANSTMNPIIAKDVKIQGRVIGVIRKYTNSLAF